MQMGRELAFGKNSFMSEQPNQVNDCFDWRQV